MINKIIKLIGQEDLDASWSLVEEDELALVEFDYLQRYPANNFLLINNSDRDVFMDNSSSCVWIECLYINDK